MMVVVPHTIKMKGKLFANIFKLILMNVILKGFLSMMDLMLFHGISLYRQLFLSESIL